MNIAPVAEADLLSQRLEKARREARLTEAVWRRKRAELARLVAAGEEAAAARLVAAVENRSPAKRVAPPDPSAEKPREGSTERNQVSAPSEKPLAETPRERPSVAPQREQADSSVVRPKPERAAAVRLKPGKTSSAKKPSAKAPRRSRANKGNDRVIRARVKSKAGAKPMPREAIRLRNRLSQGWLADARDWTSRKPSWVLSLTAHLAILVVLALLTFGSWTEPPLVLDAAFAAETDHTDVMPESAPTVQIEAMLDEPAETVIELASLSAATLEPAPLELAPISLSGNLLAGSTEGLLDEIGSADAEQSDSAAPPAAEPLKGSGESPGGVRFFGANDVASRVAFVVDNSGSMQRGRMETTLVELDRAVARLEPTQYFYVVLFSDQAYPMFFPQPADGMLPATRSNKTRLSKWLGTVEMCLGGRLLDAVELAAAVEPEVVYLLTDGDIRSQRVVGRLSNADAWDFTIHTLGMGVRTPQDASKLQVIASANNGVFRPVRAHPEAIRRAQLRPIPYHNTQGKVWGSLVSSWK